MRSLQRYQRARPEYARLTAFFLGELYGPEAFIRHTQHLQQLHDWLAHVAGPDNLALQRLSGELDTELTQQRRYLGAHTDFTPHRPDSTPWQLQLLHCRTSQRRFSQRSS